MRRALVASLLLALFYLVYENIFSGNTADDRVLAVQASASLMKAATAAGSAFPISEQLPPATSGSVVSTATSASTPISVPVEATAVVAVGPPPPPPCTSLSCAARFTAVEPAWAELTFQPGIDWHAGGIRGDCVAGELEYIMPKYCSPQPRRGNFPSEDRLNQIDVHANSKPQAKLTDVLKHLPNRTVLFMGDSVMEQFYNTIQCFLRRESIELRNDDAFLKWVDATAPLWRMGKRKKPPKLPQRAYGNTRLLYARVTTYQPDEIAAAAATADVIILNWGLHYQVMDQYREDLNAAFKVLNPLAGQPGKAVLFSETGAQHFKASDARGYSTGEWENRDKSADQQCACKPIEDYNVNVRNRVLREVTGSGTYPNIRTLPFYELTRPRWRWHFGNWCAR